MDIEQLSLERAQKPGMLKGLAKAEKIIAGAAKYEAKILLQEKKT